MLRAFKTKSELREVLELTSSHPNFITLQAALTGDVPESPVEMYAYPWPNVKCWMMAVRNTLAEPFVGLYFVNGGTIDDAEKCLESAHDILTKLNEFYLFNIEISISIHLCGVLSKHYQIDEKRDICTTFYMPPDVQAEIAKREIKLPDGFRFCDLDLETDAALISGTWKDARHDDIHFTRSKLTHRPSVGVKYGDRLVSFEIVCACGVMNHLYTVPEFRGKGLGTAVELKLCQKLIAIGICPYKYVMLINLKTIEMSKKSGYWLQLTEPETGEAIIVDFRLLKKLG